MSYGYWILSDDDENDSGVVGVDESEAETRKGIVGTALDSVNVKSETTQNNKVKRKTVLIRVMI